MNDYLRLLRSPGLARIIAAQLVARIPGGMLSLGVLLHLSLVYDSYGAAGLVLAATSVGQALAGPLTSRWMGVWGMRPVLLLTAVVCSSAIAVIALVPMPLEAAIGVAFIGGLSVPPVSPAVRTIYPTMVPSEKLTRLYSLDASAQELIWVAGPVAVTFLATQLSGTIALMVVAVVMLVGTLWFVANPEVGRVRLPRSKRGFGRVLAKPSVSLATAAGFLLILACAAIEAGVVATFGHDDPESGIVLAIWAVGSMAGGLALGHHAVNPWSIARRMSIFLVGVIVASLWLDFWWLTFGLLIAGIGMAPTLAASYTMVSSAVRFSETPEAYGWLGTGQLIGAAAGSAVAGFLIDHHGAIGGFWAAGAGAAAAVLLGIITVRWMPDLRGRDVSPQPDTAPVGTQNRTH